MVGTEVDEDIDDERSSSAPPISPRNNSEAEQSASNSQKFSFTENGEDKPLPSQRYNF